MGLEGNQEKSKVMIEEYMSLTMDSKLLHNLYIMEQF